MNKKLKDVLVTGIFTIAVFQTLSPFPLAAEDSHTDDSTTPPTEVFISSANTSDSQDPFTAKDIDSESFADRVYGQEPSYILSTTPAITSYTDSGSYQGYSYFRLRGIDQTRINMTLDGVPLNEPEDQGVYFSNYPDFFASVDRLQIVRGVGTTQNGSASYGGSIRFESHDVTKDRPSLVGGGGGSFGSYRTFAEYNGRSDSGAGFYLRAADMHSDGYKRHSGNTSQSLFYKAENSDQNDLWTLSGFVGQQANDLAWIGSTREEIEKDRRYNANSDQEDDQFLQTLTQLKNVRTDSSGDVLTSSVYYNHLNGNYDFDFNNFIGLPSTNELYNYHLNSDFFGAFSNYKINLNLTQITVGVHGNIYDREHRGSERSAGTLYDNTGRKKEASAFARVERYLDKFILFGDAQVRYTRFDYTGDVNLSPYDWTFLNPKTGITYLLSNQSNLYYSVARCGREPTRNDILAGNDNLLADETGNPLLGMTDAEYVIDHELGIRSAGETWSFQGNTYYMDFDQEIVLNGKVGPNGLPLTQSVEKSYRTGVELDLAWEKQSPVSFGTNVAINRSRIDESGEHFTPVITPALIFNQSAQYRIDALTFSGNLRYQSDSYIDFANSTKLNDLTSADVSASYQYGDVIFGAQVNNIFNNKYFSNGYIDGAGTGRYFVQAPAHVYFTVIWKLS